MCVNYYVSSSNAGKRVTSMGFIALILGLLLLLVVFFANFALVVFDMDHYVDQFERLDRVNHTGIEAEELQMITGQILSYLQLYIDDIDIVATIDGEQERLFTERELIHMEDVRELFAAGYFILILATVGFLGFFGAGFAMMVKKGYASNWVQAVSHLINRASGLGLLIMLLLGGVFFLNFDFWYDQLHIWLFDNDYWLLNPATHNLIRIYPVPFFYNTILRIILRTGGHLLLLFALTVPLLRWSRPKKGEF